MLQKIKTIILAVSMLSIFAIPALVPATALAVNQTNIDNALCTGSNLDLSTPTTSGDTTCTTNSGGHDFNKTLKTIINLLSVLVGAIAVIMIIVGGFRYVTSAGSDKGVEAAKKTILYALIGLVIVALAQVIVHFVLNNVTS